MREREYLERQIAEARAAWGDTVRSGIAGAPVAAAMARHPLGVLGAVMLGSCWLARRSKWLAYPVGLSVRLARSGGWRVVLPVLLGLLQTPHAPTASEPNAPRS